MTKEQLERIETRLESLESLGIPGGSKRRLLNLKHSTIERWLSAGGFTRVSVSEKQQEDMGRVFRAAPVIGNVDYDDYDEFMVYRDSEWSESKLLANRIEIIQLMARLERRSVSILLLEVEASAPPLEQLARAAKE